MKMNLGLKDMVKINQLFETALEVDVPLIISNKFKHQICICYILLTKSSSHIHDE